MKKISNNMRKKSERIIDFYVKLGISFSSAFGILFLYVLIGFPVMLAVGASFLMAACVLRYIHD